MNDKRERTYQKIRENMYDHYRENIYDQYIERRERERIYLNIYAYIEDDTYAERKKIQMENMTS